MTRYKFDVIIIGAGPAGVAAAGALAGTGISVALLEAGVYAGAENWSGCVYFAESLAEKDCFGPEAVAAAPYERRVKKRGTLLHNGLDVIGVELDDEAAFRNCYTVLRPLYDPYFANLARLKGAVHIPGTTVVSLIRNNGRVIGVETNRGPLYGGVTFIAEGDASHLVRSEQLERVPQPHFLQGVKAVLSVTSGEIEKRFELGPGEGAAYELLIRNPAIAGRTARLNVGGFLYANRDSLSTGYVAPLDNIRNHFRGSHDTLYEWMCGLPYVKELIAGSTLSAYGTKIVRSGGWHERPILAEDGLAVGGAATGLGIDIPFPNFTGPASATGLFFARAVRNILKRGSSLDAKQLNREYVMPVRESVYGRNAEYLSRWPGYFGRSKVLFGRTVDIACGTARFLGTGSIAETGRFLRSHILSFRGVRELLTDTARALTSLRLWKPILLTLISPATIWQWTVNLVRKTPARDPKLRVILRIGNRNLNAETLPWPVGSLINRLSPPLRNSLEQVYANDGRPLRGKFAKAVRHLLRGFSLSDFLVLPAYGLLLFFIALGTALWDAFRFYVLKTPVQKLLAEPVMAYAESQKKIRDLDLVKPSMSLDAKLATNTYRVGTGSHIRTLWPEPIAAQPEMALAGLWWVCPARVYLYDPPPFAGRGKVTVNYENCIKCESCWRAEPSRVLWGRHTDHKLIYRPESSAITRLLDSLAQNPESAFYKAHRPCPSPPEGEGIRERGLIAREPNTSHPFEKGGQAEISSIDDRLWYLSDAILRSSQAVLNASAAFEKSVRKLPPSADRVRGTWPASLGNRLASRLSLLETALSNDGRYEQARIIQSDRKAFETRSAEGRLFHALYSSRRIEERIRAWIAYLDAGDPEKGSGILPDDRGRMHRSFSLSYEQVSALFPDRIVKQWEDSLMPEEWSANLRAFISDHLDTPYDAVRAISSVNPALGLVAAHQISAAGILRRSGLTPDPGVCAVDGRFLAIDASGDSIRIKGVLNLVPLAAGNSLLIISGKKAYLLPITAPGLIVTPTPAIGFRAAQLSDAALDCTVKNPTLTAGTDGVPDPLLYLSIALGAADYLSRRVKEHAEGRIQFPGQMLDTEGRDGIAKLGAVKALIARTEAWRCLLETLHQTALKSEIRNSKSEMLFSLLCSALAAKAFGPEPGSMGYDAGQVFGGFAYSEDDLLSRFYRDSSLFRFLAPGYGAAGNLNQELCGGGLDLSSILPAGGLDRIEGEPLGRVVSRLNMITKKCGAISSDADALLAGEAKAMLGATRLFLDSIEQALNNGESPEAEAAAAEVLLGFAEEAVMKAHLSQGRGHVSPAAVFPVEPSGKQIPLDLDYSSFCAFPAAPHKSGSFLMTVFDRSPRFVPEMQLHDPGLRARWTELVDWFRKNCSSKQFDGLSIERYIEKVHHLPDDIIEAAKRNKWLATYIPQSLDGLGWHKAEYYILNSAAGSFGDASIDLLIMASTSIGTTPILLGLDEELPRVHEELVPLARDERKLGEIGSGIGKIVKSWSSPNPAWIKKEYEAVMKLVDARIRGTRVVKYLAANFLRAFYGAGIAGRRGDFGGFIANLKHAAELFSKLMPDVRAALDELPRRERCHKLFLRYLGHGGVSAFALTEPTAGSDSGGVKTTARLLSAQLTKLDDGRYSFSLAGDDRSVRYLIDSDRIAFTDNGIAYQSPDGALQLIRYDKYEYSTDQGARYYLYNGKECIFHDIGQVRESGSGLMYEFYSMTGAKMWITNASIATQFCFYAQAAEGVTGFMVDRHAEGLKVGADEKKTGQRGSPTNEISIDAVRVPREAVIGYEGHGQVNALETLNVGRCGLAVVSGALMRKLMAEAAETVPASPHRDKLLGEAAAVLFGSESLAYYLVGLFDRSHESVRMESAIAKYVCSEDIHELITLLENAFGPEGQTEKFLLEKARRDSRILTIYEGTNEVQRFLILKDLIAQAAHWPELDQQKREEAERTLAIWKNRLRNHVREAAGLLGDTCWSDAMLQPAMFPLSEMAGEILRLECISYRMSWIEERGSGLAESSPDYARMMLAAGRRAVERTLSRLEYLEAKYLAGWENVKNSMYMPEVRAADAGLDQYAAKTVAMVKSMGSTSAPVRILSIIRPVADLSPRPRVRDGEVRELVWRANGPDLAALTQVLQLKKSTPSVVLDVLMPGGPEHDWLLRITGAEADNLYRIAVDPEAGPGQYVKTVKELDGERKYNLVINGSDCLDGDESLGPYLAGALKRYHCRRERLEINPEGTGFNHMGLPAVVSIAGTAQEVIMDINAAVRSAFSKVQVMSAPIRTALPSRFDVPTGAVTVTRTITTSHQAAEYLKAFAQSASAAAAPAYIGEISHGALQDRDVTCAILDPNAAKANRAVLRASAVSAGLTGKDACAIIPAPRGNWPELLGLAKANGCVQAFCIDTRSGRLSEDGKREVIRRVMKTSGSAMIFSGTDWAGSFAFAAAESESAETTILLCSGVTEIGTNSAGSIAFSLPVYNGKLMRQYELTRGSAFVTVAPEADFAAPGEARDFKAFFLDFTVTEDALTPLQPVAPQTLSQADVILDLGYGIKDRSGFELARELKKKLEAMGLAPIFGATRKVTQDLKLLPLETQIGQTGVRVNPKLIIALGISGAPQHIDYIGTRAEILCLNKDPEAPLMKLNQTRTSPRVHPILGDLFVMVREIIEQLG